MVTAVNDLDETAPSVESPSTTLVLEWLLHLVVTLRSPSLAWTHLKRYV